MIYHKYSSERADKALGVSLVQQKMLYSHKKPSVCDMRGKNISKAWEPCVCALVVRMPMPYKEIKEKELGRDVHMYAVWRSNLLIRSRDMMIVRTQPTSLRAVLIAKRKN